MLSKFSTKQIIFAGLMGALMFTLSFVLGSGLNIATGNPAASGLISCLIQAILMTLAVLISKRFGIVTLMWLVYGFLAIPTNMLGGLPGIFKIILALSIGLIFDFVVFVGKYKKSSLYLGFVFMYLVLVPLNLWIYSALGLPGKELLFKYAPYLFTIFLLESFLGIWLGLVILRKIRNNSLLRQFS